MDGLIISSRVNGLMAGEVCNCPGWQARIRLGRCCGSYLLACGFSVMLSVHRGVGLWCTADPELPEARAPCG